MGTQCTLYTIDTVFILMLYYTRREKQNPQKRINCGKKEKHRSVIKSQNKLESSKKIDKSSKILLFHERKYCEDARNVNLIIKTKHTEAIKKYDFRAFSNH